MLKCKGQLRKPLLAKSDICFHLKKIRKWKQSEILAGIFQINVYVIEPTTVHFLKLF